jgi:hypothetical protein
MRIINSGSDDTFVNDASELLEGLQQRRSELIDGIVDVHLGIGLLIALEADRLAQKQTDDPRVPILRTHAEACLARVDALSVERDIAAVRAPSPPANGAVVQGRLTDVAQRAAGSVTVVLVDDKQQPVTAPVESDETGYYAFVLDAATVTAIGKKTLTVMLRDDKTNIVATAAPFTVDANLTVQQDRALSTAELEQLQLRAQVLDQPVPAEPQPPERPPLSGPPIVTKPPVDIPSVPITTPPDKTPIVGSPAVGTPSVPITTPPDKTPIVGKPAVGTPAVPITTPSDKTPIVETPAVGTPAVPITTPSDKTPIVGKPPVDKPVVPTTRAATKPAVSDKAAADKPVTARSAPTDKAAARAKRAPAKAPAPRGGEPGAAGATKRGGGRKKR